MMFLGLLVRRGLMTIKARKPPARMGTQFKFMHHGVLQFRVALRTFSRSTRELRTLSACIGYRSLAVDEEGTHHERESDY
jgi:hypothetical protein